MRKSVLRIITWWSARALTMLATRLTSTIPNTTESKASLSDRGRSERAFVLNFTAPHPVDGEPVRRFSTELRPIPTPLQTLTLRAGPEARPVEAQGTMPACKTRLLFLARCHEFRGKPQGHLRDLFGGGSVTGVGVPGDNTP